jgi:hypothetical protein
MEREEFMKSATVAEGSRFNCRIGITEDEFLGKKVIKGSLLLNDVEEVPEGFNPKVTEFLELNKVKVLPEGFSPEAGLVIILGKAEFPKGFNPKARVIYTNAERVPKEFTITRVKQLSFNNPDIQIPEGFSPKVNGHLQFQVIDKIPDSFSPRVKGNLILCSVKKIGSNFSPIIGGDLGFQDLRKDEDEIRELFKGKLKGKVIRRFMNKWERDQKAFYL